ncbi:hypothetical protein ACTS95_08130 [Empedobacter brevis]
MTPRKELFVTIQNLLKTIPALEIVDLYRAQFENNKLPNIFTGALIRINRIDWECMTEQNQEGQVTLDILFYCKDGWMDQHHKTSDPNFGLTEIDVIDTITEELQFLKGEQFTELHLISDETLEQSDEGIMSYVISFKTMIYRKFKNRYPQKRKLTITT